MRGKLQFNCVGLLEDRITPADAGKTSTSDTVACERRDHPRGCGENAASTASMLAASGSPPRMRGKPACVHRINAACWITPADAGKTSFRAVVTSVAGDHPRGCGENCRLTNRRPRSIGSPPRMRGKLIHPKQIFVNMGITPADAGKTIIAL